MTTMKLYVVSWRDATETEPQGWEVLDWEGLDIFHWTRQSAENELATVIEVAEQSGESEAVYSVQEYDVPEPPTTPPCACRRRCGDALEYTDDPRAVCKGLPR